MKSTRLSNGLAKIKDAAAITGCSEYYLRKGCKEHTIPYVVIGNAYYIDCDALLANLTKQAQAVIAPPAPRFGKGSRGGRIVA